MERNIFLPEHDAFRGAVRELLIHLLPSRTTAHRAQGEIGLDLWHALGDHGFLGFMVPEEYGGGGSSDFRFNAILGEELAQHGVAYASSVGINTDVIAPYLIELGSDEQKDRWLPGFASGRLVTAIGMTEPSAGSDLGALKTKATATSDGWSLSGSKTFITNGICADVVVVAATTQPDLGKHGISLFVVPSDAPGFSRGRKLDKIGQPEVDTGELFFDDVHLDRSALLGTEGHGWRYMVERLPQERLSVAVVGMAHARWTFEQARTYAIERSAFGRSIASFQNTKFVLADLYARLETVQVYVDACIAAHCSKNLRPEDAAIAKLMATELQGDVADAAVQIHGGYGYMTESAVARAWVDARVTRIYAGTSEIMREVIGRSLTA